MIPENPADMKPDPARKVSDFYLTLVIFNTGKTCRKTGTGFYFMVVWFFEREGYNHHQSQH